VIMQISPNLRLEKTGFEVAVGTGAVSLYITTTIVEINLKTNLDYAGLHSFRSFFGAGWPAADNHHFWLVL